MTGLLVVVGSRVVVSLLAVVVANLSEIAGFLVVDSSKVVVGFRIVVGLSVVVIL